MTELEFLTRLKTSPHSIAFSESIAVIEANYQFNSVAFSVGSQQNAQGENQGSCKLLAFGKLNDLSAEATLNLFGDFYRKDVLENPNGTDHQNIRNFIDSGWEGVTFEGDALTKNV